MVNKVILSGTLDRDPEMSYTPQGIAIVFFSLKTRIIGQFGAKQREVVNFVPIRVWRQLAEDCYNALQKDMEVCVAGKLVIRSYKGHDRFNHIVVEITADEVILPDGRSFHNEAIENEAVEIMAQDWF